MDKSNLVSDKRLEETINNRIRWDIRVSQADVLIKVYNGRVSLYGYFDKPYRHKAVVDIIESTEGVEKLKDLSQVVNDYYRGDKEIESLITNQMTQFPCLKGEWIDIKSADGVVKLEGEVYRPELKAFAAKTVWELSGVQDCINLIQVKDISESRTLPRKTQADYLRRPQAWARTSESVAHNVHL